MSTAYSASVLYAYALPRSELERHIPNPLWGKVKFDPDTGDKVTQFIEEEVELTLEEGDNLKAMTRFTRVDSEDTIMLGVLLDETGDLNYGDREPQRLNLLSLTDRDAVEREARKLLDKAGIAFDGDCLGYWLVGSVF